jgi:hypothetical protein
MRNDSLTLVDFQAVASGVQAGILSRALSLNCDD